MLAVCGPHPALGQGAVFVFPRVGRSAARSSGGLGRNPRADRLGTFRHLLISLNAQVVACNAKGIPEFAALHGRTAKPEEFCAWAFDLLELNGKDQRPQPLSVRRAKLAKLLTKFDNSFVRFSEGLADADKLLAECERLGLEGIVSKRGDQPYRAGRCDWVKVKTKAWREANRNRRELFKNRRELFKWRSPVDVPL